MKNIKITYEYDGSKFHGFQKQLNSKTVQGSIEKTIKDYFDEDVNAPVYSSTWAQPKSQNYKAWAVTAQYALFDNVGLSAFYFFNGEDQKGNDVPDFYRAQVDFKF